MKNDGELLRRYSDHGAEEAFAELVRRQVDLVYGVALRQLDGDVHRAKDITQSVFADLARKAKPLSSRSSLAGWLHISVHHAVAQLKRSEQRRRAREQEAHKMHEQLSEPTDQAHWERLRPVLDATINELGDADRDAVLLRFFQQRPFDEIAIILQIGEEAARKRVTRALDKLQASLARRGITSTAVALGTLLANQTASSAPAGLATAVTSAAIAAGAMGSGVGPAAGLLSFMSTTKIVTATASLLALFAVGSAVYRATAPRGPATASEGEASNEHEQRLELTRLRAENTRLVSAQATEVDERATLRKEVAQLKIRVQETERSAAMAAKTEHALEAGAKFTLAKGLKPVDSLTNAGKATPTAALETRTWAFHGGDTMAVVDTMVLPPATREKAEELFARLPETARARYHTPEELLATAFAGVSGGPQTVGIQVLSEKVGAQINGMAPELHDDPGYKTLHVQTQDSSGAVRESDAVFQQTGTGWQQVILPNTVAKAGALLGIKIAPSTKPNHGR